MFDSKEQQEAEEEEDSAIHDQSRQGSAKQGKGENFKCQKCYYYKASITPFIWENFSLSG